MSSFFVVFNYDKKPLDTQTIESIIPYTQIYGYQTPKTYNGTYFYMSHSLFDTSYLSQYDYQPLSIDNLHIVSSARLDDKKTLFQRLNIPYNQLDTLPDNQLILYAYQKWGEKCTKYLFGDFAFVIIDTKQNKLFSARDIFGTRQLYYAKVKNSLIVSNRLEPLLKHPDIDKTLNDYAVGGFLLFGRYTWMDKSITMYKGISTLPPTHLVYKQHHIDIKQYWHIPQDIKPIRYKNPQDYIEHFLDIFYQAVSDRITTTSTSISMSGGMDSTSIAAMAKRYQQQNPSSKLNIVSVTNNKIYGYDEYKHAKLVAQKLNLPIEYIDSYDFDFLKADDIYTTYPINAPLPLLAKKLEKSLSNYSNVTLVGDGSDELFSYPSTRYSIQKSGILYTLKQRKYIKSLYNKKVPTNLGLKTKLLNLLSINNNQTIKSSYPYPAYINSDFAKKIDAKTLWDMYWEKSSKKLYTHHEILEKKLLNASWCTEDIFLNLDFPITQKRDPYLDIRMLEFVLSIPPLPWLYNKHLLRSSMTNLLPKEVIYRPKTVLKEYHKKLALQPTSSWIKSWYPKGETLHYIDKSFRYHTNLSNVSYYINSRPIILQQWLNNSIL